MGRNEWLTKALESPVAVPTGKFMAPEPDQVRLTMCLAMILCDRIEQPETGVVIRHHALVRCAQLKWLRAASAHTGPQAQLEGPVRQWTARGHNLPMVSNSLLDCGEALHKLLADIT